MPCPRTVLLSACLDPEWTGRRRALIQAHVVNCPVCAAELQALRTMTADLRALPDPDRAPDFSQAWHPAPARRRRWAWFGRDILQAWLPTGAVAAASLAVGIGLANWSWPVANPAQPQVSMARLDVFGTAPPGGLCAAGLCGSPKERT